ncbi:MAG TPA: SDR family NAD(P)-dependent oxidoreductase, partial [Clostridiales bacterium]|nr:SDR family NAD(P)-dependent oxidoreductase [Clostridiales bacterium]
MKNAGRFENKVAFVTGVAGEQGMGFAVAKALAEEGASLGIVDVSE